MSMPFCVIGRAAMKMTSSTSSTSIIGVTFMSAVACGISAVTTLSAPKCLCACAITYSPPSAVSPGFRFVSVMRPTFSICASRILSIICITDAYGAS